MWLCCCYMQPMKLELTLCFPSFFNESASIICNSLINYSKTRTCLKGFSIKTGFFPFTRE